jgi:hypothetical protein
MYQNLWLIGGDSDACVALRILNTTSSSLSSKSENASIVQIGVYRWEIQ